MPLLNNQHGVRPLMLNVLGFITNERNNALIEFDVCMVLCVYVHVWSLLFAFVTQSIPELPKIVRFIYYVLGGFNITLKIIFREWYGTNCVLVTNICPHHLCENKCERQYNARHVMINILCLIYRMHLKRKKEQVVIQSFMYNSL